MLRSALVLAVTATLAVPGIAHAAAGDLDPSFSSDGRVVTSVSGGDTAYGVAIDSQGRIVAVGDADDKVEVTRYLPDGRLDQSFSHDGKVVLAFADGVNRATAVATDARDRVVVVGSNTPAGQRRISDFGIARLRTSGRLDPSFSGDGRMVTHVGGNTSKDVANSAAIDSAGRIVAAGSSRRGGFGGTDFTLIRYRSNGTLDPSFSGDGEVRTSFGQETEDFANSVAIDSGGRIVAAGVTKDGGTSRGAVARYRPNGNLDPTFSGDGRQVLVFSDGGLDLPAVATDAHNRVVLTGLPTGTRPSGTGVARLLPNGSPDPSFAGDGRATTAFDGESNSVAIDPNGRIVTAGYGFPDSSSHWVFQICRFTTRGALDRSFSGDGRVLTSFGGGGGYATANAVAIDPLGRIVAAGRASLHRSSADNFALVRYLGH